jgi:hypothetical protein
MDAQHACRVPTMIVCAQRKQSHPSCGSSRTGSAQIERYLAKNFSEGRSRRSSFNSARYASPSSAPENMLLAA